MLLILAMEPRKWQALVVLIPVIVFVAHLLMTTDYTIDGTHLRIRCGFFKSDAIEIASIQSIAETRNPLSSPALSLDRLDIKYNERYHIMISPKGKKAFIDAMLEINPNIAVRLKNKGI
jgi:hypothetical protein